MDGLKIKNIHTYSLIGFLLKVKYFFHFSVKKKMSKKRYI